MVSPTPHQNNTRMSRCGSFAWSTVAEKALRSDSRIALPPKTGGVGIVWDRASASESRAIADTVTDRRPAPIRDTHRKIP